MGRRIAAMASCSQPLLSLLERCSGMRELKAIHAQAIVLGLARYAYIAARILAFCAVSPRGSFSYARQLFDRIPLPTVFHWNTMIRGCSMSRRPEEGLLFYVMMRRRGVGPNMHTFPIALKACIRPFYLQQVHCQLLRFGFHGDVYVVSSTVKAYADCGNIELAFQVFDLSPNKNVVCWTSLISGCCARGQVARARHLFEKMPEKNDSSWSAIIKGHVQNELHAEAIELFRTMKASAEFKPNGSVLVSVLAACSALGDFAEGEWVESYMEREGLECGLELGTALIDFYAKCGRLEDARRMFVRMTKRDVTAWSAMIMGLAVNGRSRSALDAFSEMLLHGVAPNAVTFIGILCACNHGGLVEEGWANFKAMSEVYGISPTVEHYSCMVDLLSRAGDLVGAAELIGQMPMEPDGAIWGSLLRGCVSHGCAGLGEGVGRRVIELDPRHGGRYVGLANAYAVAGRWDGVAKVRRMMKERGVATESGWSSIEVGGAAHRFLVDDRRHPHWPAIHAMLHELSKELDPSS